MHCNLKYNAKDRLYTVLCLRCRQLLFCNAFLLVRHLSTKDKICLAVSPSMKALGVKNRCRIKDIPRNIKFITAQPRMQFYIDCAAEIHGVFLKHFAPQDIYTYSIDESFIDATPYLKMYNMPARDLAKAVIEDVRQTVGTVSTCGIGTNMFLAKVALDIQAKHAPDFIAELNEEQYHASLWDHRPITDFWGIGPGTMADIKAYKSESKSLSSSQVLMRNYRYEEAEIIAKEMVDQLCLDMTAKGLVTESVGLYVGYSYTYGVPGANGTARLASETNAASIIIPAVGNLYRRIVNPAYGIRRVCLSCNNVVPDRGEFQLSMIGGHKQ